MEISSQNAYLLALQRIDKVGPITAKALISYCGGVEQVFSSNAQQLMAVPGVGAAIAKKILSTNPEKSIRAELELIQRNGVRLVSFLDKAYPERLKHHESAPMMLYVKGEFDFNPARTVALVGTRKPSNYGLAMAEKIVDGLKQYNVTIVSGLAYGIDTKAHQSAVQRNIPTIGILGNGLSKVYPATNKRLATDMLQNGGLVSEFNMEMTPLRENFPQRNRIISALSDAVVVVESAKSGGSIITSEFANQMNKDVFAVPGEVTKSKSEGCNNLIKINKAHLLQSADDIAYIMRWDTDRDSKKGVQRALFFDFDTEQKAIYDLLKQHGEVSFDDLHFKTSIPISQLSNKLLTMEFQGAIKSLPGKMYLAL